jgi:ADP-ribosylglycohydrolase
MEKTLGITNLQHPDRVRGGVYGLLVGDALGVPYEFHDASEIPAEHEISRWHHRKGFDAPIPGFRLVGSATMARRRSVYSTL